MNIALSTIGLSAYNVLTRQAGPTPASLIHTVVLHGLQNAEITQDVFARALAELEARGFIRIVDRDKGLIDVTDDRRRLVRWRDRTEDGWANWLVDDIRGPQRLASIDLGDR